MGLTKDPEQRLAELPNDYAAFSKFEVHDGPLRWAEVMKAAGIFAQGHGCEYDYMPSGPVLRHKWYVYHFFEGGERSRLGSLKRLLDPVQHFVQYVHRLFFCGFQRQSFRVPTVDFSNNCFDAVYNLVSAQGFPY